MVGGKEIDTTKVDSVKSIDEYDGETQGAIRKIMFDQDQKAKVRPHACVDTFLRVGQQPV